MGLPIFSILLPTHNRADVLGFAIESALAQTVSNFELLIVGDGCTDHTADVVKRFQKIDSRIQWFDLPKAPGFGMANRNVALKKAKGEFVAFLAHDDLWLPDHLELTLKAFDSDSIDLVYSRPVWVTDDNVIMPICFNLEDPETLSDFLSFKYNAIPASAIVHRRSCFDTCGMWDSSLLKNGDWDLWFRILLPKEGKNCRFISETTALHFHAIWKNSKTQVPEHLHTWRHFYQSLGQNLPEVLRLPIEPSSLAQEVFWRLIGNDENNFIRKLRQALVQVIDRRVMLTEQFLHTLPIEPRELGAVAAYVQSKFN